MSTVEEMRVEVEAHRGLVGETHWSELDHQTMDDVFLVPRQNSSLGNDYTFILTAAVATFLAQLISLFLGATSTTFI